MELIEEIYKCKKKYVSNYLASKEVVARKCWKSTLLQRLGYLIIM